VTSTGSSRGWCRTATRCSFIATRCRTTCPAHVRAALTAVQLSVPLAVGRLALGTWQGIYLWEHPAPARIGGEVVLHLLGE